MSNNNSTEIMDQQIKKLIILFLLSNSETAISREDMNSFIMESEIIDYFTYSSLLEEMCQSNFVEELNENNTKYYVITDTGLEVITGLEKHVPISARTCIIKYIDGNKIKVARGSEISAHYFNDEETNSWIVKGNISDSDFMMMEFSLTFFTEQEAIKATRNWNHYCSKVYGDFLEKITDDLEDNELFEDHMTEEDIQKILDKGNKL
ncbi:MAG: DUF4364 family protein [Lachnospirales bacterium]